MDAAPAPTPLRLLREHLPELIAAGTDAGLENVTPADDGVVAVDLRAGATYADVARFEARISALLGGEVLAVSTAAAVRLSHHDAAEAAARGSALPRA